MAPKDTELADSLPAMQETDKALSAHKWRHGLRLFTDSTDGQSVTAQSWRRRRAGGCKSFITTMNQGLVAPRYAVNALHADARVVIYLSDNGRSDCKSDLDQ